MSYPRDDECSVREWVTPGLLRMVLDFSINNTNEKGYNVKVPK